MTRIYIVSHAGIRRLIRAANQAAARSHAARSIIEVKVASVDESIELARQGVLVEDAAAGAVGAPVPTPVSFPPPLSTPAIFPATPTTGAA